MATKRSRRDGAEPALFEKAIRVLLQRCSDFLCGHETQPMVVALLATNHRVRRVLTTWMQTELMQDITRGHNATAIPVRAVGWVVQALLELLRFRYVSRVQIPLPYDRHCLPMDQRERLQRESDDVARVARGCCVSMYAVYTSATGWGIHAAQIIERGEYVGEYTGELISSGEARRRHDTDYDRAKLNYVLALRERTADSSIVRTNVDATRFGGYARFFNHSCEPTLRVEALRVDSFIPRLVFFTQRAMSEGETLTFDYGCGINRQASLHGRERRSSGDTSTNAGPPDAVPCHCGAAGCRGTMPFDRSL